jgi:RND family efflux transporter MFP subunit
MLKKITLLIISISLLALVGCGKKEVVLSESIEQIQAKEGVPVKVVELKNEDYSQELSFSGKIKGLKESTVTSSIAGRIETIVKDVNSRVKEDDVVINVPTDVPASQFSQAQDAFKLAENTYNRMLNLFKTGAISQQDLDQVEVQYKVAKSNFESINKILNIESPINGVISIMYAQVGEIITPGQILFQVIDDSCYKTRVYVPESQIKDVKKGQKVTATWNNVVLTGKVAKVSTAIDDATNAFIVDILYPNNKQDIKIGVTADIKIEVYNTNAIAVESQYVLTDGDQNYVYVQNGDKAQKRIVKIARRLNGKLEVASGLNAGDILISEGTNYLSDNSLIKIVK